MQLRHGQKFAEQLRGCAITCRTEEFLKQLGESWTPEMAGSALVDLVRADAATTAPEYLLTGAGLQRLP